MEKVQAFFLLAVRFDSVFVLLNINYSFSRMPVSYQYSALGQFDNDPDEDVIDPENSLNMMVEDSTSDDDEIVAETKSSKTIGAIDLDNPPDADAVSRL